MSNPISPHPIEFRDFDPSNQAEVDMLGAWSIESGEMIPISSTLIDHHQLATGAYINGELAGYCAMTEVYSPRVVELGGLVVNPHFRSIREDGIIAPDVPRYHVGSNLVKEVAVKIRNRAAPNQILAFSNEKSQGLFSKLGGQNIPVDTLAPEVWKLCDMCPRQQAACMMGKVCCDRVFDITGI